jgi:hypothetical protein
MIANLGEHLLAGYRALGNQLRRHLLTLSAGLSATVLSAGQWLKPKPPSARSHRGPKGVPSGEATAPEPQKEQNTAVAGGTPSGSSHHPVFSTNPMDSYKWETHGRRMQVSADQPPTALAEQRANLERKLREVKVAKGIAVSDTDTVTPDDRGRQMATLQQTIALLNEALDAQGP